MRNDWERTRRLLRYVCPLRISKPVEETHLLARGSLANDNVIMIRVELLTIHACL